MPEISGNTALNILHISTQVPNVWEYVSDGSYRDYMIGKVPLKFRHVMPREINGCSSVTWNRISIKFKLKFYYTKNASYETAHFGTLRLVPCADAIKDLSIDYEHMKDMIYGEKPSFDEIIKSIRQLEEEINGLA